MPDPLSQSPSRPSLRTRVDALRASIEHTDITYVLEAHNGLCARIVEEAGFPAIWASSFTISAQWGVRDCNEASWTQILDLLEHIVDATRLPVILDADSGYGNFNNFRRLVQKCMARDVAGICIQDTVFPNVNSLWSQGTHCLCPLGEYVGKLRAARDTADPQHLFLIARTEALIATGELHCALDRMYASIDAGADAILIQDNITNADRIMILASRWQSRSPLIIVPTSYALPTPDTLIEAGVSAVIWANQLLRASCAAMRSVASELFATSALDRAQARLATMEDIFRLQNMPELQAASQRYLHSLSATAHADVGAFLDRTGEHARSCGERHD